jgi:hypothetical protein
MGFIVIGILIGIGIILAPLMLWLGVNALAVVGVAVVVSGVGLFASSLVYSAYLQAPWMLVALILIGGFIFVTARRGSAVRRGERT